MKTALDPEPTTRESVHGDGLAAVHDERRAGWFSLRDEPSHQSSKSAGTLPPFSASFRITCLCSQIFMGAVSFMSPV